MNGQYLLNHLSDKEYIDNYSITIIYQKLSIDDCLLITTFIFF